jgi:arylsulfatase A-like enzyme
MDRRQFLKNSTAAAVFGWSRFAGIGRGTGVRASAPNILLFLIDDLGWGDVGFHDGINRTPVIDRLVKSGVELTQHYVCPQCSPTRLSLLTGRYSSRFGVNAATNDPTMPLGTLTLASALKSCGYQTALTGKWHLGSDFGHGPNRYGFDHSYGNMTGACHPWDHTYRPGKFERTWHRNGVRVDEKGHTTDLISGEAVRWLEARGDRPWFLYVPFTAVHLPVDAPRPWIDLHKDVPFDKDPVLDESKRRYAAMVSHMDDAVGRIVAAVDRKGQLENTIIVFFSDNGSFTLKEGSGGEYGGNPPLLSYATGSNGPLRGEKSTTYEGGIRVPAFAYWKGRLSPRKVTAPTAAVDWMPTLLSAAGCKPTEDPGWNGLDILRLLTGEVTRPEARTIYTRYEDGMNALRDGDWKLVTLGTSAWARGLMPGDDRSSQLFNIAKDPFEANNLARVRPDILARLSQKLADEMALDERQKRRIWGETRSR